MGLALKTLQQWFSSGDASLLAENIKWKVSLGYPVPRQEYTSREEVFEQFFPELTSHFSEWKADPELFLESGDHVTVKGRYLGRIKRSDKLIEVDFIHIWTVHEGIIIEVTAVADTAQFAQHHL